MTQDRSGDLHALNPGCTFDNLSGKVGCDNLHRSRKPPTVMGLVDYSDSDDSDDDKGDVLAPPPPPKAVTTNTKFSIDRSNPQKIRVNLNAGTSANGTHEDEPAPKRARVGGGGSGGFNSMLPPPKKDTEKTPPATKVPARKVFNLKTGAEPGFSRESDAELRQFFAEQDAERHSNGEAKGDTSVGIPDIPKKAVESAYLSTEQPATGNTFMFKPLSVARGTKKKKPISGIVEPRAAAKDVTSSQEPHVGGADAAIPAPPPKKVSLFSSTTNAVSERSEPVVDPANDDIVHESYEEELDDFNDAPAAPNAAAANDSSSLNTIATDLNLSAAERRQLFGRSGKGASAAALNVVNFNTDAEYAANEEIRAGGDQQQHNPLRAIAPGKHSLKSLVSNAQGQKDALEESFASGRRNKKEAGNKYGW